LFVTFQTKEGAKQVKKYADESRRTCYTADWIWQELNITNISYGKAGNELINN